MVKNLPCNAGDKCSVPGWGTRSPKPCCSVAKLCPTLCDPMNCSTSGFPVLPYLEFTQTHVHWVGDAIQPSHPLSSPSPAFNIPQHQGLFQWVDSSHQVAKDIDKYVINIQPYLCLFYDTEVVHEVCFSIVNPKYILLAWKKVSICRWFFHWISLFTWHPWFFN